MVPKGAHAFNLKTITAAQKVDVHGPVDIARIPPEPLRHARLQIGLIVDTVDRLVQASRSTTSTVA
ncbi:MAG: hypothetical protein M3315_10560, partial [Actinomycetota bacterium]|nr:hypothetical protein [Actinomycetota bacterium]